MSNPQLLKLEKSCPLDQDKTPPMTGEFLFVLLYYEFVSHPFNRVPWPKLIVL